MSLKTWTAASLLALAAATPAWAAADLQLSYLQPSGTVAGNVPIDVWVRLSNVGDEDFSFTDFSSDVTGLPLPTQGVDRSLQPSDPLFQVPQDFDGLPSLYRYTWRSCGADTFVGSGCQGGPYRYGVPGGNGWFNQPDPFTLPAGASVELILYTFTPISGTAPAGDYTAANMGLGVGVRGTSAMGAQLEATLFDAGCLGSAAECVFTRTVTAVPEPSVAWMLALGLGGLALRRAGLGRRSGAAAQPATAA